MPSEASVTTEYRAAIMPNESEAELGITGFSYPQAGILTTKFNTMNNISNNHKTVNEAHKPRLRVGDVTSGASCSHCCEWFEEKFVEDFVDGVCLPCQSQIFIENEDRLDLECLARYNKKHKTNFTIDSFWESAQNGEIEKSTCKGFPRMREILEWFEMIEAEYLAEQEYWKNYQPTLFGNVSELPF